MNYIKSVVGTLMVLVLASCGQQQGQAPLQTFMPVDQEPAPQKKGYLITMKKAKTCEDFLNSKDLPKQFEKGSVEVPEDWDKQDGNKIKVAYFIKHSEANDKNSVPFVFFNGGPGRPSHKGYKEFSKNTQFKNFDIVLIDQRGTGCSTPFPVFDRENPNKIALYASKAIVQDAEAIRKKLYGEKKWKVFGRSYGGLVVHRYVMDFPKSIEAAFSYGFALKSKGVEEFYIDRIKSQQRVIEKYFEEYGEDRARLKTLRELTKNICFRDKNNRRRQICGDAMLDSLFLLLAFPDVWETVHGWLSNYLFKKDGTLELRYLTSFVRTYIFEIVARDYGYPGYALTKVDWGASDDEACRLAMKNLGKEYTDKLIVNECKFFTNLKVEWSGAVAKITAINSIRLDDFAKHIKKNRGFKFYLYSGEFDTLSPKESFGDEVKALGDRITYRNFTRIGHAGFRKHRQFFNDMAK